MSESPPRARVTGAPCRRHPTIAFSVLRQLALVESEGELNCSVSRLATCTLVTVAVGNVLIALLT